MKIPKHKIVEGNRILAKYMRRSFNMSHIDDYDNAPDSRLPKMKYHTSWDWLMPVAKKCISSYGDKREDIFKAIQECDKEALWVACINFILWCKQYPKPIAHYIKHGKMMAFKEFRTKKLRYSFKTIDFMNGIYKQKLVR